MDLFNNDNEINLLPYDGEVIYYGHILSESEAWHYYNILLNEIAWQNDEAIIFGKRIITKRKVAWYGNENYSYTYSGTTKTALPWTKALMELKELTEKKCGSKFNSCLLNLYHDGDEGMAWHSDDEKSLGRNTVIGSLSFGAVRKFSFKHKGTSQKIDTILDNGSLLVMKGETQTNWLHRLPPSTKIKHPRINLTFRTIVTNKP
ncbi:alpha-ketoglutarate-dependent dioxygenase AlkB family protein [Flavobacterium suzhouense]|uniref:Alpha-ketoglutarate-dependent dioxygenase AlkB family protein n=1 Tax=Flavobacterium suzhouense TaxID=1529638 RepID=A0ABW5NPJ2_9FLAO